MIEFKSFVLKNGLTVIHHYDPNTPLCVLNILYKVGSKNELPDKTGFAHLFEHLMFGGSINIPNYDQPIQLAGGENNAFTNQDVTNYYVVLPASNIETAFWLESDRMLGLALNEESLSIQKKVVIEEFKERYLNQPYGDVWKELLALAYVEHPYQWQTIGKEISHIEGAELAEVEQFFNNYYAPENAILVICGNVSYNTANEYALKWFDNIPKRTCNKREVKPEPPQKKPRTKTMHVNVPSSLVVRAYHCAGRNDRNYYATDLLSDILGSGKSSRLHQELVLEQGHFTEISSYITGDFDSGLFVIEGMLSPYTNIETATKAIDNFIQKSVNKGITQDELVFAKRKTETQLNFNNISILNKAQKLAFGEMLGNANIINEEWSKYDSIDVEELNMLAKALFAPEKIIQLNYLSTKA
ncbi:MAG: insulinase family protein [Bacteroidia bacterium]|nr:insulinase family protein [Bacteroidia bacterium]